MIRSRRVAGASFPLLFVVFLLLSTILWLSSTAESLAEPPEEALPNIIFVVVDALRADHVSSYGYHRQTTPNIDAWVPAREHCLRM